MPLNYVSHLQVLKNPKPNARLQHEAMEIGCAAFLMAGTRTHLHHTIFYMRQVIEPAVRQKRMKLYFDVDGNVVGYVIWAFLVEDVGERVKAHGEYRLHESEWNEGTEVWVVDFLVPFGNMKYVLADLRDTVFKDVEYVRYIRRRPTGFTCKTFSRNEHSAFFKALPPVEDVDGSWLPDRFTREQW